MSSRCLWGRILGLAAGLALAMAVPRAFAQADTVDEARTGWDDRIFIHVNGGYQTATPEFGYLDTVVMYLEQATAEAAFQGEGSTAFEVGGGVRLVGNFGVGAAYSRYTGDQTARLQADIPNPLFWEDLATGELSVPTKRREEAVHFQALYMIPLTRQFQIAVFGGPSWFNCRQDAISTFKIRGSDPLYNWTVELSDPETVTLEGTTWGYNVGTDVNYLFSKHIGVGALVRYSGASLDVENALSMTRADGSDQKTVNLDLGGLQILAGLRIRF